jgi:hypothetical protein
MILRQTDATEKPAQPAAAPAASYRPNISHMIIVHPSRSMIQPSWIMIIPIRYRHRALKSRPTLSTK